ncbi:MAG TPA: RidA family protein [Trueperaceae bacterium]|mgnify:CR=1 FL=1|nr:RidA family protein [Trueperaceae bacterium]
MTPEHRLEKLGIELPAAATPVGLYQPVVVSRGVAYLSGQGPTVNGRPAFYGQVGGELTLDDATQAARLCALNALAVLRAELGSLNRVRRIVKVLGFIASAPGFHQQPIVLNGASTLLNDIFPTGHARSAIGTNLLPFNIPVEVELVAELEGDVAPQ